MLPINISITTPPDIPNAKLLHFDGNFDGYAEEAIKPVSELVESCPADFNLIFDFSKLSYLNSYAVGQLVAWHNHLNTLNSKIMIVGTNKSVQDIFSVLGINNVFKLYATLDEAKKEILG